MKLPDKSILIYEIKIQYRGNIEELLKNRE